MSARSAGNTESHKLPLSAVEMIEKEELMKSRNLKLKRNMGDKKKKAYHETKVRGEKERDFKDGKDFVDRFLDDKIEDRGFDGEKRQDDDELYKTVLRDLEDLLDKRDDQDIHYREEKRRQDARQGLLDEIDEILQKN